MITKDTDKYIDRPFNIRPICFWAFFVSLTVVVCLASRGAVLWVGVYFVLLIGAFIGLQFVKSRDKVLSFFGTSRVNFIVTIALCLTVALSFAITTLSYTQQKSFAGFHDLSGVVERHSFDDNGTGWFILTNAKFGTTPVSGKVRVFVNNPNETATGNVMSTHRISANTQLHRANANDWNINNSIKYTASISAHDEIITQGASHSARSTILRHSQSFLRKHMSNRNADLMFAMLFGDRSTLDGEVSENFSLTGLAHVLAVSGLHVGVLVGMLVVVLKLCRISRKRQLPIIATVLLAYCYLCGFRYSILRASIMFMVFVLRRAFLKSNDLLSSISFAAIVILLLFPYSLMSVSFQLSFACVLGIALFRLPLTNSFKRICKKTWLASALAMYFATFLGCLPLMVKYFGFISLLGIFTNILFLPLLVVAFQISFVAALTWFAFPLLYIVNVMLNVIITVTKWAASLPFAALTVSGGGYWFLLYFVGLICTTRFIFSRPRHKYPAAAILILIYGMSVLL